MRKQIYKSAAVLSAVFIISTVIAAPAAAQTAGGKTENTVFQASTASGNGYAAYYEGVKNYPIAYRDAEAKLNAVLDGEEFNFEIEIPEDGLYTAGMLYKSADDGINELEIDLKTDGKNSFEESRELKFPRIWKDESENRTDGSGNQFAPKQITFEEYVFKTAQDISKRTSEEYLFYLTAGRHSVSLRSLNGKIDVKSFVFAAPGQAEEYKADRENGYYKGEPVILEGEKPYYKTGYWLSSKADNSSAEVTPNSVSKTLVNYIGGGNWKTSGEEIVWKTPELKAGYYCLGFSYRQSAVINGKTYRALKIDGETPFAEAAEIGFAYGDGWQQSIFGDNNGKPYMIYLSEGSHELSLTCTPGEMTAVRQYLESAVSRLGELYIDITMITGEKVDIYRDYDLFTQIEGMEESLNTILAELKAADKQLTLITGKSSGSQSSSIKSMIQVIEQMLANKFTAHRYKNLYYDKYCAVSSVLNEMRDMPLDIDRISLFSPDDSAAFEKISFFERLKFSVMKFFVSFFEDYDTITENGAENDEITVWVNWGRDQAQVLNSMVRNTFTAENGIKVNIKLVTASIVQAKLSDKAPDCILQQARSEPVNLAMRGVLYDLSEFDDCDEVLNRFKKGADIPYRYNGGLYGLPDTQIFYVMYYRRDILAEMGIDVPETWDEFTEAAKILSRHNLSVWLPNKAVTDMSQANAGIGSINIFPSMLLQQRLSLYSENGRSTTLSEPEIITAFGEWTDYYRKLKLPITLDFYNRFRTGTCPIGIEPYTLYTILKAAAPEIDGLWGISVIPGTATDGRVSHISSGGGTAAAILKESRSPEASWEFLKWWTSAETQLSFSNEAEALLGPTGRVAVANVEAFEKMAWDKELLPPILEAWDQVEEIPEYPGSYYVSRSLYQSFWNVVDSNKNIKDMLLKYGKEANEEIARKWNQYENRG